MICRYCSRPFPDAATVCPSCGQPTGVMHNPNRPPPTMMQSPNQPYQPQSGGFGAPGQPQSGGFGAPGQPMSGGFGAPGQPYQGQSYQGQPSSQQFYGQSGPPPRAFSYASGVSRQRSVYIILGLFLGGLGIHNFYAGYHGRGIAQLLINLLLGWWLVFPALGVMIWVLIEICTVTDDADGVPMT